MKHALYFFFALTLIFQGCKKGEDDPFISLRSRKGRLKGDWVLKTSQENYSSTTTFSGSTFTFTSTTDVAGGTMTVNSFYNNDQSTESYDYSMELSIRKDGQYRLTTTKDGDAISESDLWFFNDGNKKKIGVQLGSNTYKIKELRHKKLVLTYTRSERTEYDLGGYSESNTDGTLEFIAK